MTKSTHLHFYKCCEAKAIYSHLLNSVVVKQAMLQLHHNFTQLLLKLIAIFAALMSIKNSNRICLLHLNTYSMTWNLMLLLLIICTCNIYDMQKHTRMPPYYAYIIEHFLGVFGDQLLRYRPRKSATVL